MLSRLAAALGGLLVAFHAWLLVGQAWDGQLAEPGVVLRWLVAAGLVAALAGLRRRGGSSFLGRRAVSIWLLAALLHGPALVTADPFHGLPGLPEAVVTIVQTAAASLALGLGLALLALLGSRQTGRPHPGLCCRATGLLRDAVAMRLPAVAPRPPPFLASARC